MFRTVDWADPAVLLLDQRLLPGEERTLRLETVEEVARAIEDMAVRGAPAIGITAAMGVAVAARRWQREGRGAGSLAGLRAALETARERLRRTRPTAVNLFWALERMRGAEEAAAAVPGSDPDAVAEALVREAQAILDEDVRACRDIGWHGREVVSDGMRVLTHCNAGGLATGGYGTALGVIRAAWEAGRRIRVLADETRPFLQGARLTAWELRQDGIPVTLITDSSAGALMSRGEIDLAVVGADRIARNGDVANKIGTYTVAVLAREHGIPFYVAAPLSTVDFSIADGSEIPIEERSPLEVETFAGVRTAPEGIDVRNPAFDVTPARLVTGIVTEKGIARAPFGESLERLRKL